MEIKYSIQEIKEAGSMFLVKLTKKGILIRECRIERFTEKKVYFEGTLTVPGLTKHPLQTELLHPQLSVTGKAINGPFGPTGYYIEGAALVLEQDIERTVEHFKEEGPKAINERIQKLQEQADTIKHFTFKL